MGSGSALVAAARLGRRYVGYDLDESYIHLARRRVTAEVAETGRPGSVAGPDRRAVGDGVGDRDGMVEGLGDGVVVAVGAASLFSGDDAAGNELGAAAAGDGRAAQKLAEEVLTGAGFTITGRNHRLRKTAVSVSFVAVDGEGATWYFDVCGAFTSHRGGLLRADTVWKSLGRACAVKGARGDVPLVFVTSHLPRRPGEGDTALRAAGPDAFSDVIGMLDEASLRRLTRYAKGGFRDDPQPGFWTTRDLARRSASAPGRGSRGA
jgi:site-specific DNA-methyltransferase (adenine-specific)